MNRQRFFAQSVLGLLLLLASSFAFAQATRTWVSGVGDDANPCSRTAPCKTFAGAISKTSAGGTIDVLDPGGFGAVTITKAITLENVGEVAGVLVSGTNGIVISAGVNDVVVLRGLSIDGINGQGLSGVRFLNGAKLVVERCVIQGFSQNGIDFEPSAASLLVVTDTTINLTNATGTGLLVQGAGAAPSATVERSRIVHNGTGVQVKNGIATIRNSTISQNAVGAKAFSSSATARIALDDSVVSENSGAGVVTSGTVAAIVISRSAITNNLIGVSGTVTSFGDNRIFNNTSDGSPSGTLTLH